MGIGNTAASAMLMHGLTGKALIDCVGRGTGLDDAGLERKRQVLAQALKRRAAPHDPLDLLAEFGGYEIAMLAGAMLEGSRAPHADPGGRIHGQRSRRRSRPGWIRACWSTAYSRIAPRSTRIVHCSTT